MTSKVRAPSLSSPHDVVMVARMSLAWGDVGSRARRDIGVPVAAPSRATDVVKAASSGRGHC